MFWLPLDKGRTKVSTTSERNRECIYSQNTFPCMITVEVC